MVIQTGSLAEIFTSLNGVRLPFQGKQLAIKLLMMNLSFWMKIRILENIYPLLFAWQLPNTYNFSSGISGDIYKSELLVFYNEMCQPLEICVFVLVLWKVGAKIRVDIQESYWWEYLWRIKGESQRRQKQALNNNVGLTPKEGRRKVHGVRRVLDCSSPWNVSTRPMPSSGVKLTSLRRSASQWGGTALVLLLCAASGWQQPWEAWPPYKHDGGSRRIVTGAVSQSYSLQSKI